VISRDQKRSFALPRSLPVGGQHQSKSRGRIFENKKWRAGFCLETSSWRHPQKRRGLVTNPAPLLTGARVVFTGVWGRCSWRHICAFMHL